MCVPGATGLNRNKNGLSGGTTVGMNKWTVPVMACVLLGTVTGAGAEGRGVTLGADFTPDSTVSSPRPAQMAPPPANAVSPPVHGERATPAHQAAPALSLAKESGTTRALRQTTHQLTEMTRMRDAAVQRATTASAALKACQEERVSQCPAQETADAPVVSPSPAVPAEACPEPAQTETVVMALQAQLETQQTEILRLQLALASAQAQPRAVEPVPASETPAAPREQNAPAGAQTMPEQVVTADAMTVARPALSDDTVRQSYASGVALAYLVRRDLETQRSLGLEQIPDGVLAGFVEEFRGQSRMSMEDVQRWVRKNESAVRGTTRPDGRVTPSVPAQTR